MSLDAQAMLEVNREAIYAAAQERREEGVARPLVVSVATFGRGLRQDFLQQLTPYRRAFGHNQSLVCTPPEEVIREFLAGVGGDEALTAHPDQEGFWALGLAFGKSVLQWWSWDGQNGDDLF